MVFSFLFCGNYFFEFVHKGVDVFEFPVYGGKTDVGNGIQAFESVHYQFTYDLAGDFFFFLVKDLCLHFVYQACDLVGADGSFVAGAEYTGFYFGSVVGFPVVVFFDDYEGNGFYFFVGGEAFAAFITYAASSDGVVFISRSGVDDSCVVVAAKWTFHNLNLRMPAKRHFIFTYYNEGLVLCQLRNWCSNTRRGNSVFGRKKRRAWVFFVRLFSAGLFRQIYNYNIGADLLDIVVADYMIRVTGKKGFPFGSAGYDQFADAAAALVEFKIRHMSQLSAVSEIYDFLAFQL